MSSSPRARRLLFAVACVALLAWGPLASAGRSARADAPALGAPVTWVRPERTQPIFWSIWADVRDLVGEEAWAAIDTAWMPARAREDLEGVGTPWRYGDPYLLAGLWRLGVERDAVLRTLAAHEPEPAWPLTAGDRAANLLWQPRLARWLDAQPEDQARTRLRAKLEATWAGAVAAKDLRTAERVVESLEVWLGAEAADALAPAAGELLAATLPAVVERACADPRGLGGLYVPVHLLERFGVPAGVDLHALVTATRRYEARLLGETIPLPHPYALRIHVLRLERLLESSD